jgi:glycosyltransferase involved in cell wall biosynthesis
VRILHVIPYMHPNAGGPPVVVENFVRETGKLGHSSEIVSSAFLCNRDQIGLLKQLNKLAPTEFVVRSGIFAPLHRPTWRQLGQRIQAADIVHVHTLWNSINVIVQRECARINRPYVLMPHGMLDPYSLSVKRWRKSFYLWALEGRNISSAQGVIYTSLEEARLAETRLWSLPKRFIVPLGGDRPSGNSDELASEFLERFPKARNRRQLLFLGRLHFKKGLDRILMTLPGVIKKYPNVLLTIVGGGSAEFEASLNRQIGTQGLQNYVLMTGSLSGAVKWGAYASAELFLLPSRQENFALTVAEAMQMGVPVIISSRVNTWPYVKDAGAGLILNEERISQDLEEGILSLLKDCAARRLMGRRGQEYARTTLTWASAATKLLECYEEVLARYGAARDVADNEERPAT